MAARKRKRISTRSKQQHTDKHVEFKKKYKREPRKLTDRRKRLIKEYMQDSQLQGNFGTTQWITGLIGFLKESKRNDVTPSDVQEWMKNSDLFPTEIIQQHGLPPPEANVDSLRFSTPPASSYLPSTSGNQLRQPEIHGNSEDGEETECEKDKEAGTEIVEGDHSVTTPPVSAETSHNACSDTDGKDICESVGSSSRCSIKESSFFKEDNVGNPSTDSVIGNTNDVDVEPQENSSGAENNAQAAIRKTDLRSIDFTDFLDFCGVQDE